MADFVSALFGRITTAPLVAADLGARLYPVDKVPQNAMAPYGTYQVISDDRPVDLKGYSAARVPRIQYDIYAEKYGVAKRIAENIIAAVAVPGPHSGVQFGFVKAIGPRDLSADSTLGTLSRASLDLLPEHRVI
jgi:hypothetical protein